MLLDILLIICVLAGFINGYRRGLIRALFTFVALFFGVLLALKYSYIVSDYFYRQHITQSKFLPLISFVLVFSAALLLINLLGKFVEKMAEAMLLGVVNKLIGGLLEAAIMVMVVSTLLWYLDQLHFISPELQAASKSYEYLISLSPAVISFVSKLLPFFSDVFKQLEQLFEKLPTPQDEGSVVA
ncbi:MAG: CvpA family protein [Chitinophagales bacterium]|nr:CvpA family protein [Chitinophagales bacterium]